MNIGLEKKYVFYGLFIAAGLIFIIRLFYIQVIVDKYKLSANNNVLRYITQYPARGLVYDRNGKLLVHNEAVYDLMVVPKQVKGVDTLEFCRIIGITREDFIRKMKKARQYSRVKSSIFEKQLSSQTYGVLQEKLYKFPGFYVESRTVRKYAQATAAHLLGYIGEVDDRITAKDPYYRSGDYIGISGIELSYEKELRGRRGVRIVMVDVHNNPKGSFADGQYDTLAIAGRNLVLSLDLDLQLYGEKLMQGKIGSIVALEPSTGEILTMVSNPSYDPNLLVGRIRTRNYGRLLADTLKPLFNRALMAYYPPGSTFKLINALIGLQEGALREGSTYPCSFYIASKRVNCHPHPAPTNLHSSIQYSCNPYYCHAFKAILDRSKFRNTEAAYETWRRYVLSFGVSRKLNLDLPHELPGFVPQPKYYDKYYGKGGWKSSTIVSLAIGQGELLITPLQMANIMAIIANRGHFYVPHIIKQIGGKDAIDSTFTTPQRTLIAPKNYDPVVDAMQAVVDAGTAVSSRVKGITICGKTGTAQNPHGKDHSLFYAFAPRDNPRIAIAVVVENSGFGGTWAAPIATLMIEKYLTDSTSRPAIEKRMLESRLVKGLQSEETEEEIIH